MPLSHDFNTNVLGVVYGNQGDVPYCLMCLSDTEYVRDNDVPKHHNHTVTDHVK